MANEKKYGEIEVEEAKLIAWENPTPERDYLVEVSFPEFTCLCPRSGYPDFATIRISYTPDKSVVELKSIKLYLNSYRNMKISHEESTNKILDDINECIKPKELKVIGDFNVRGNVKTVITATL
ncbi:MAG: NADPH-dependent 7-cyano-7-deazaguanine reductase QueF [Proteobacteria bacterium]|nr:NADPH-dependent 7-cyano-7-deazaguanine reductase QueF [Pseudomonadota bacterium]